MVLAMENRKLCVGILAGLLLLSVSCRDESISREMGSMYGQEVSITLDSFQIVGDTCLNQVGNRYPEKRFRLVVYSDSNACSSCRIRELGEWNDFLDKCRKYKDDLDIVFIVSPKRKDRNVVRFALKSQDVVVPVCIDTSGLFMRQNDFLPSNPMMHTFLTERRKIILVGSPHKNRHMENLFWDRINSVGKDVHEGQISK